jgi:hypothetical protein
MARRDVAPDLDRDLAHLPPEARWHEWLARVEAVLFASAAPVPRAPCPATGWPRWSGGTPRSRC